jgi:hypothetical protein
MPAAAAGRQKRSTRAARDPLLPVNDASQSLADDDGPSSSQQISKDTSVCADAQTNRFKHLIDPIR